MSVATLALAAPGWGQSLPEANNGTASSLLGPAPAYDEEDAVSMAPAGSFQASKYHAMISSPDTAFRLGQKYDRLYGIGAGSQSTPALTERHGAQLAKPARYLEPGEGMKVATDQNHETFKRSGSRDPNPCDNGVVRECAYADLLLVKSNPVENIVLSADPH